jgi:hypothetical protein
MPSNTNKHVERLLGSQEIEIRKIAVRSQPKQIVGKILARKNIHKKRGG